MKPMRRVDASTRSTASSTSSVVACEKRPIGMGRLSELVDEVEARVTDSTDREISTAEIGELLMHRLQELDKIAYVRFASVYRDFQDEQAFLTAGQNPRFGPQSTAGGIDQFRCRNGAVISPIPLVAPVVNTIFPSTGPVIQAFRIPLKYEQYDWRPSNINQASSFH